MAMIVWEKHPEIEFYLDATLRSHLDSMCYDAEKDFDFVIIVAGNGEVRVGKTLMAIQVATYMAQKLKRNFDVNNIVFSGKDLREGALNQQPSIFIYDEARAELDSKKWMHSVTQTLLDFFAECGKLNHIVILVLPDFFELPQTMATARSECLINVYLERNPVENGDGQILERHRGQFAYFTKKLKKTLYFRGKKEYHNYNVIKPAFLGKFSNKWLIDRDAYEKKKDDFIRRVRTESEKASPRLNRMTIQRNWLLKHLREKYGLSYRKIAEIFNSCPEKLNYSEISRILKTCSGEKGETPDISN